jgi:GNAT superfamily N-acetyltransferase
MAVTATGKVLGVVLNASHQPGQVEESKRNADVCPHPRFRKILQLLATVESQDNVFSKFPDADRLLEVCILSVDSAARGQGIAKALIERTRSAMNKIREQSVFHQCLSLPVFSLLLLCTLYSFLFSSFIYFVSFLYVSFFVFFPLELICCVPFPWICFLFSSLIF